MPEPTRPETWKPVPGFPSYEVSDMGRVRSLDRLAPHGRIPGKQQLVRGRLLKPQRHQYGYHMVTLYRDGARKLYMRLVHRLVLEAFAGPRPPGMQCLHGPGGKLDNRWPENLKYGTPEENAADKVRDGTHISGEQHYGAKLTEEIVRECRRRYAAGESQGMLAREFGVLQGTMGQAIRGVTWRHVV